MEALKVLNSCNNIVKIRDTTATLKYKGESNYGAILMDFVEGKTLDLYDWNNFTQLKKYELCFKILQAVYNQCHLDKFFYDENSISYAVMH